MYMYVKIILNDYLIYKWWDTLLLKYILIPFNIIKSINDILYLIEWQKEKERESEREKESRQKLFIIIIV